MTVQVIFILLLIQLRNFALGIQCKESKKDFNVYYKEKWNVNLDLFDDTPQILQVCPIPNTNEVNFYGKYRDLTIVGNRHHVSLYELYPSDDSHVCYKDGLYFVASKMLCKYGYSEEVGKIECSKFEGGIIDFKMSNSYNSSFFHISISTLSSGYFCFFPNMACISNPHYRYNNITSIVSISESQYLISGISNPLCYILVNHTSKLFVNNCRLNVGGEGNVIKSGGTYDPRSAIVHKVEQIDRIYFIQLLVYENLFALSVYKTNEDYKACFFTGFIEVRDSRLYTLIKCNTKFVILIQKNQEVPIIFETESHLDHSAGVSQNRFFIFSISENRKHLNFSNAPLNSIHSIDDFSLLDYCPLSKVKSSQFTVNEYYSNSTTISFTQTQFNKTSNIKVNPENLTDYSNINFNVDDCFIDEVFYNPSNIEHNLTNCRLICTETHDTVNYTISYFQDRRVNSIKLNNSTNPVNFTNIPIVMKRNSEEIYTFIIGASFGDKTYKSLISFSLRQCSDYCKECKSSDECNKCLYDESKSGSKFILCPSKNFTNLKLINIIIAVFIIALLLFSLFEIVPWHSYINACNHYHSMLFILFFSIGNYNSLSYFYSFLCILSPYFSPLIILNIINQIFKVTITSKRMLISLVFYRYLIPDSHDEDALFLLIILSCTILYFVFMITKLCAKKHFLKYSKAILDNSTIYYSIINFLIINCGFYSSNYIYHYLFHNYEDYITARVVIFSLLLLATVSLSNYSSYFDLKYALKEYTMKLFNVENAEMKSLNCIFIGLQNNPGALLYNILYCIKRYIMFFILTLQFMCIIDLDDLFKYSSLNSAICLFLVVFIECCWLCYLVKAHPYRSFSENRILIVNQIVVVTLGICSSIFWIFLLITYDSENDFLDIIDWISCMCVLPISYTLFCFHYIFIKTCYKKKKNLIYPRFWKLKNPNRHFASENSFTGYMAYNPYGEY